MPALVLLGLPGARRLPPLPLPVFLLWPLVPLFLLAALALRPVDRRRAETLRIATMICCHLRGLTIDVDTADRERVLIRFV